MAKRADNSGASPGVIGKVSGSLFRLNPLGDAARLWGSLAFAVLLWCITYTSGSVERSFIVIFLNLDVFYIVYLASTWAAMYRSSAREARRWALAQNDDSRRRRFVEIFRGTRIFSGGAGMFTIISFSVVGLLFALALLPGSDELVSDLFRIPLSVVGVVTAWALLHTSYALYYTHLYYHSQEPGGFAFPGDEEPDPLDFTYFAFTLGTSFAASDVVVNSRRTRRAVLFHGVLSFFYNTAILALVVNLVISRAG